MKIHRIQVRAISEEEGLSRFNELIDLLNEKGFLALRDRSDLRLSRKSDNKYLIYLDIDLPGST